MGLHWSMSWDLRELKIWLWRILEKSSRTWALLRCMNTVGLESLKKYLAYINLRVLQLAERLDAHLVLCHRAASNTPTPKAYCIRAATPLIVLRWSGLWSLGLLYPSFQSALQLRIYHRLLISWRLYRQLIEPNTVRRSSLGHGAISICLDILMMKRGVLEV